MTEDTNEKITGKPWRCPQGHLLGHVFRNQKDIRYLEVVADPDELMASELMIIKIIGDAEISCPYCGEVRNWIPGEEAIKAIIERSERMKSTIDSRQDSC